MLYEIITSMARNKVSDFMVSNPTKVSLDISVTEVAKLMLEQSISSVIIVKDNKPIGIVTERDLVHRVIARGINPNSTTAFQVCSKPVISILSFEDVDVAVEVMRKHKIRRLVVINQYDEVVGILTTDDIGYNLKKISEELAIKYLTLISRK